MTQCRNTNGANRCITHPAEAIIPAQKGLVHASSLQIPAITASAKLNSNLKRLDHRFP